MFLFGPGFFGFSTPLIYVKLRVMIEFLGKKLLFVVAHPDDESFTSAGTIYLNHKQGGKNYIFCATLGEQGKSHLKKPVSVSGLKKIRRREIEKAAKFLKIDGLFFDRLPDTKVNLYKQRLWTKINFLIKKVKPDYIFSFGPDGISGHLDHVTVGQAAKAAAKKAGIPFVTFAASPTIRKNFADIAARRKHGKYIKNLNHGIHNTKIKINNKIKQKTLSFHKSQAGPSTLSGNSSDQTKNKFLTYEYFII